VGTTAATDYPTDVEANARAGRAAEVFAALDDARDPSYGGTWIGRTGVMVAQVGDASPVLAARLAEARRGAVPVTVVPVAHSFEQLRALTRRISEDIPRGARAGSRISVVGPDVERNRVQVSLERYSEERAKKVTDDYPGEPVFVGPRSITAAPA
jgi:hypothetical protein